MFQNLTIATPAAPKAVVFAHFEGQAPDPATQKSARANGVHAELAAAAGRTEATGECGVVIDQPLGARRGGPERLLLIGLGKKSACTTDVLRHLGGVLGRKLASAKITSALVDFSGALGEGKSKARDAGQAVGEGLGLVGWVCDEFKGKGTPAPKRVKVSVGSPDARFQEGMERGVALGTATNLTRTLSQTPPNIATPDYMAQQAQKVAKACGLSIRVMRGDDLVREKMIGHINVGKASENKPCVIRLEYKPKGGARGKDKPAVLIGKTVCYDTGGLSLKVNNGMVGMKRDKDGGCAVLGAMWAIAKVVKPNRRVVAILAAAENSISDEAYRPDDILRYRNNVTVEVTNTDAEGRLVLADALVWACEKEDPAYIVDLATLTGGVVVALGSTYCGMFCEDDRLRGKIERAAAASGELVWRLPMHAEYREMMKSPVADIVNSNPNRKAHPIQGAAFLSYFVDEKVPWCHLDIAGVHVAEKNAGPYIEGPKGWGVRLLANLVDQT